MSLELYSAPGAGPQKVYQTTIGQGYKGKGNNNEGGFTKLKTSKRYLIMKLTRVIKIRVNLSRVNLVER